MPGYDAAEVASIIDAATAGPGGIGMVVGVFAGLPGVSLIPAKKSLFRSEPERVTIADWEYSVTKDGRLTAAHIIGGIAVANEGVPAHAVGAHVARALGQIHSRYGAGVLPQIAAALDVLRYSSG